MPSISETRETASRKNDLEDQHRQILTYGLTLLTPYIHAAIFTTSENALYIKSHLLTLLTILELWYLGLELKISILCNSSIQQEKEELN